jgi:hypothetical protein
MTPAEKRVKELIDRWLTSLDLHLGYVDLNDSAYNNVQPWPVHDRPTRWVLELAKQKALELQAAFDARLAMGDAKFAEVMELMNFLSTLVGIQHVQRYIPLADPQHHGQGTLTEADGLKAVVKAPQKPPVAPTAAAIVPTVATPTRVSPPAAPAPIAPASKPFARPENDVTREMPRPVISKPSVASTAPPANSLANSPPVTTAVAPPKAAAANIEAVSEMHNLVINDAVRLLNWGRPWHELAELIARIADRPKLPEVRRLLRSHRAAIEMRIADAEAEKDDKKKDDKKDKKDKKE